MIFKLDRAIETNAMNIDLSTDQPISKVSSSDTSVLVVIVNYRTPRDTCNALESIVSELPRLQQLKVVVTDNHSGDDSVEMIEHAINSNGWTSWASVMSLERNGGFAYGNNAAIRHVLTNESTRPPNYVMLLNPDALVEEGAIAKLVDYMNDHPKVGVAGSNVFLSDGRPQTAARRLPTPISELEHQARTGAITRLLHNYKVSLPIEEQDAVECEWVSGAAMMIRTEVFDRVGLIDEGYFLYFEEVDFCSRVLDAGFQIVVCPNSHIVHLEGAATNITEKRKRRGRYWYESRRRFFVKRYGVWGLIKADFFWAIGRIVGRTVNLLRTQSAFSSDPSCFVWDLIVGDLRAIVAGEATVKPPQVNN